MTTTQGKIKAIASILGLGALLVFTGCVKQHSKRATRGDLRSETRRFAIVNDVLADQRDAAVQSLGGSYKTETDYLGCESVSQTAPLGVETKSNKVVVLVSGKKMACVKVDELEAHVESFDLGAGGDSLESQFAELEANDAIEDELAALKARVNKPKAANGGKKKKAG
jgi:hypothetical protein